MWSRVKYSKRIRRLNGNAGIAAMYLRAEKHPINVLSVNMREATSKSGVRTTEL